MHHIKWFYLNTTNSDLLFKKSKTDATMAVKKFIEAELEKERVVIMASLGVNREFDAARWTAIIKGLRDAKCTQNLHKIMQGYFRDRRVVISLDSCKMENNTTKGFPRVSR